MGVLVTGDLHFTDNPRDAYRHRWMDQFIQQAEKLKPRAVYILGDLTEEKDRHSAWLTNRVVDYMWTLSQTCPVVILQGNHDYKANPESPFFAFLSRIPDVTWVRIPMGADALNLPSARHFFLPHSLDPANDWRNVRWGEPDWVFAHQTFAGADGGYAKLQGVDWKLVKARRVIAGDIHVPQTMVDDRLGIEITYAGAPYLIDFGDDYEPRVLWVEGTKLKSIPVECPQKRLVEMRYRKGDFDIIKVCGAKKPSPGDLLKVRVDLNNESRDQWPSIKKEIEGWAADNEFLIHAISPAADKRGSVRVKTERRAVRSDKEIMEDYAKRNRLEPEIVKAGMGFLDG